MIAGSGHQLEQEVDVALVFVRGVQRHDEGVGELEHRGPLVQRDLGPAESMPDFERRLLRARAVLTLRRLPVAEAATGKLSGTTGKLCQNIGVGYGNQQRYAEAVPWLERAVAAYTFTHGAEAERRTKTAVRRLEEAKQKAAAAERRAARGKLLMAKHTAAAAAEQAEEAEALALAAGAAAQLVVEGQAEGEPGHGLMGRYETAYGLTDPVEILKGLGQGDLASPSRSK